MILINEVAALAIKPLIVLCQGICCIGNGHTGKDTRTDHFVEWFLDKRGSPRLHQAADSVLDDPFLLDQAVGGVVGRVHIKCPVESVVNEKLAHVRGEGIRKEVDVLPRNVRSERLDPILIGEAETEGFIDDLCHR